ncbi:MAG: Bor family protein [Halioglobus sp.]
MVSSKKNRMLVATAILIAVSACSSVTIRPEGGEKDTSAPSYMDSKPFYFWGIKGEHEVDVNELCEGAEVSQMQTVMTSSDWMFGYLTLFIYSPRTVKIWCEE